MAQNEIHHTFPQPLTKKDKPSPAKPFKKNSLTAPSILLTHPLKTTPTSLVTLRSIQSIHLFQHPA